MHALRVNRTARLPIFLILLSITMVAVDGVYPAPGDALRSGARTAFAATGSLASGFLPSASEREDELQKENDELRRQLADAQGALLSYGDQSRRLADLQRSLDLPSIAATKKVTAPVVATKLTNFDSAIEIGKGTSSGVKTGMPVVNGGRLVGRVTKVATSRATVLLVNDSTFEVGLRFPTTGDVAIGVGQGEGKDMRVDLVDPDAKLSKGDVAVTNGQQFSLFPAGIPVATVVESKVAGATPRKLVTMAPVVDLDRIDYVDVLRWEAPL